MFRKILIANRGEIALRIQRACRELGIHTVAVYSDVDRNALHVRYADEAYLIGPAPSRESYLRADKILEVARKSGADAIHPGYGFLAEREDFAQACIDEGIIFIGPKPSAIAAMGDKAVARATVQKAGVPVVPGTEGEGGLRDEEIVAIAPQIGFPLLVKATAGGGGKGMRQVDRMEDLLGALASARREAEAAFGDGAVYLEKLVAGRAPHRDSTAGRRARQCHSSGRARMLDSTPPSKDHRRVAVARDRCGLARADGRGGGEGRAGGGLSQRRHDRISARQRQELLLPRNEHALAGGASHHRDRHRHRHRQRADPHRARAHRCA